MDKKPISKKSKTALKEVFKWMNDAKWVRWIPFIPGLVGVLLYVNTLGHQYALDDAIVITENMFTTDGFKGIPGLLKYDTFYGFFKEEGKAQLVAGGRYRPLTPVMFALENALFGDNPFFGHLINILLYGLLGILTFHLLRKLLNGTMSPTASTAMAFFGALIFIAHPLHTEAVANIKGRDEIVTLLACLGAWWAVLQYYDRKQTGWIWLAGIALFAGLMAKEHAITFLAVIPASLWVFRKDLSPGRYLQMWPLILATGLFLAIRGQILGWGLGEPSMEMLNNPFVKLQDGRYVAFSFSERWGTIFYTLLQYIKLLIWPWPLTHDYYPRHIGIHTLSSIWSVVSILIHVVIGAAVIKGMSQRTFWGFWGLYYIATLSIMSNIFFPVGTNMSERFLFMPSLGFVMILVWGAFKVLTPERGRLIQLGLVLLIGIGALLTVIRNPVWKDNYTLFTTDVNTSVNSAKLQNACGGELIARAIKMEDEGLRNQMLEKAVIHLKKALEIHPVYKNACLLLGNAHNYLMKFDDAVQWYERALQFDPNYAEATNNLQITLRDAGRYHGEKMGDLPKAMQYLKQAERIKPGDFETLRLLGIANGISGSHQEAIRYFESALSVQPDNAELMVYIGNAYFHAGKPEETARWHAKAKAIDPEVLTRLGVTGVAE